MKLKGTTVKNDNIEYVVIPRKDKNLVFTLRPVLDYDEFDNYLKEPTPPTITMAGGATSLDYEDRDYKRSYLDYLNRKSQWTFIQSLMATEELELEKVKLNDPSTWLLLDDELREAGFTINERNQLWIAYEKANSINKDRLEEARNSFLATIQKV